MATIRSALAAVAVSGALALPAVTLPESCDAYLTGRTDRDNPVSYRVGDPIEFRLTLANPSPELTNGDFRVQWIRLGDDGAPRQSRVEPLDGRPLVYRTSLDRPGFVFVKATVIGADGKTVKRSRDLPGAAGWENSRALAFSGGAGVEIGSLRASYEEPKDFDAFWRRQRARLAAVPVEVLELREMPAPKPGFRAWAVTVACAGPRPVMGYLAMPADAAPKSLKAVLSCMGYGDETRNGEANLISSDELRDGEMQFLINAHGFDYFTTDPRRLADFHDGIRTPKSEYAMSRHQNEYPEGCYFNGMALRVMRSLEYLQTRPEWNGRDLECQGGSQGGLQTLWAASLCDRLTAARAEVPWGGDWHMKEIPGRIVWSCAPDYVPGLAYYDSAFHARRAKCRVDIVRAGLGDRVCPCTSVAVIYNNLPEGGRSINWVQGSTHGLIPPAPVQTYELPSGRIVLPKVGAGVFTGDAGMLR